MKETIATIRIRTTRDSIRGETSTYSQFFKVEPIPENEDDDEDDANLVGLWEYNNGNYGFLESFKQRDDLDDVLEEATDRAKDYILEADIQDTTVNRR
jgi:hypothetical protein